MKKLKLFIGLGIILFLGSCDSKKYTVYFTIGDSDSIYNRTVISKRDDLKFAVYITPEVLSDGVRCTYKLSTLGGIFSEQLYKGTRPITIKKIIYKEARYKTAKDGYPMKTVYEEPIYNKKGN